VQVAQPDVGRVGGLGEAKVVCDMAAQRGLIIVPHCWKTGVSISATAHLAFTVPHCAFIEYLPPELCIETLRKELANADLKIVNGEIPLPTKAGLGFDLNWDALKRYTVA
jgi:L-alanine-DL-glutamate epimerase-like enolase superfamily enzyme